MRPLELKPKYSIPEILARWVLTHRILIVVAGVLLAVPAAILTASVRIDNSSDIWFRKDFPFYLEYRRFTDDFGSDRFFIVSYTHPDLFSPEPLAALKKTAEEIRKLKGVEKVVGLLDAPCVRMTPVGPMVGPFLGKIPEDPGALETVRSEAFSTPLFKNNLISADGKISFLYTTIGFLPLEEKKALVEKVRALLARIDAAGGKFHLAGIPFIEVEFDHLTRRENAIFIPLSIGVIVLTLFLLFRSIHVTVLTVPVLLLCVAVTISAFTLAGKSFNLVTSLIPPLLLSIGIANCVHILVHYREEMARGLERREALTLSLVKMFRPCLFTSLTTAAGFFSLAAGDIPPVREAGVFGAAGLLLAFVLSFTLFPATISFLGARHFRGSGRLGALFEDGLKRILARTYGVARRGKWPVLALSALCFVLAVAGLLKLQPETDVIRFFKKQNHVRADWGYMEGKGVGLTTLEIVLRGKAGTFLDPAVLEAVGEVQDIIDGYEDVLRSISAVDLLDHAIGRRRAGRKPDALRRMAWERILKLLGTEALREGGVLRGYVNADASAARVAVRVLAGGSHERLVLADRIKDSVKKRFPSLWEVEINGAAPLFARIDQLIANSQKRMAVVAGFAVFLMTLLLLRSLKLGLLAMIPNIMPVLMTLGLMGWTKIPLDVGTMIIAGVAVGIAVDDTIHYLTRFERERKEGKPVEKALRASSLTVGRAMVFTSIILFMGFGIIGLSSFRPVSTFGLLTGFTMILALVGDLILLPALLMLRAKRT